MTSRERKAKNKKEKKLREQQRQLAMPLTTIKPLVPKPDISSKKTLHASWWVKFLELLAIIGFIITVVCAYFQFYPWISVEPISATSTGNFLDTMFQITNESPITVYSVGGALAYWDGDHPEKKFVAGFPGYWGPKLEPHISAAIKTRMYPAAQSVVDEAFKPKEIERPYLLIDVVYTPLGISHFQRTTSRLFFAYRGKDGTYIWCASGSGEEIRFKNGNPQLPPP